MNGEINGKGKEYTWDGRLLFEGEYLNGKRWNGKRFLYQLDGFMDRLYFEGEIVKGEIIGKGKEYFKDGKILFEGEYLNGFRWNGRGYDKDGNLTLELKDGNGKGKIFLNEIIYEGGILNGKKNGQGKEYYSYLTDTLIYEGEFLNDERNGKGKEYLKEGEYSKTPVLFFEGEYLNGKRWNGKGYDNHGNLDFEVKDGKGREKEYNFHNFYNKAFEGEYLKGEKNGIGKEYDHKSELIFEGEYLNGLRHGKGKEYRHKEFIEFEGEYLNGLRNGKGKEYEGCSDNRLLYEGEFMNGKKHGKGKEYIYKGFEIENIYEGEFLNGEKNGKGKEYNGKGKVIFEGEYLNGKRWYSTQKFIKNFI